jgi:hypothetical protein
MRSSQLTIEQARRLREQVAERLRCFNRLVVRMEDGRWREYGKERFTFT